MVALNYDGDEFLPSKEAIASIEKILGYTGSQVPKQVVTKDVTQLVDSLRSHLDEIGTDFPDVSVVKRLKNIIDVASAIRQYAKHAALDLPTINHAAELQMRAERKMGQWLTKHLDE